MEAISAICIAIFGLILTIATGVVFIKHNNTPVVKSSTRELSYMILFAMLLCYANTFFLVAKPHKYTCFVTRVLPGFAFAMMYGALVTKTNRIARILAGSKKKIITRRPRFMSATAQVVITWVIVLIECCILVFMLIREPADKMHDYPTDDRVVLVCNTTTMGIIAPLGFDFFLIAMCTLYAFKTRNVPENFNEAKFIGFTMYTTLVIWVAFVVIYFSSEHKVTTLSLCISFSALFALFLLFFPRCYIIILKPEKNNRSYFTTIKNIRCHIGYQISSAAVGQQQQQQQPQQPQQQQPQQSVGSPTAANFAAFVATANNLKGFPNSNSNYDHHHHHHHIAQQQQQPPQQPQQPPQTISGQLQQRANRKSLAGSQANNHQSAGGWAELAAGGYLGAATPTEAPQSNESPAKQRPSLARSQRIGSDFLWRHQQRDRIAPSVSQLIDGSTNIDATEFTNATESRAPSASGQQPEAAPTHWYSAISEGLLAFLWRRSRRKESDKASNIQRHLRAIRRAENLDRETHFRRSQVQRLVQRFDSTGDILAEGHLSGAIQSGGRLGQLGASSAAIGPLGANSRLLLGGSERVRRSDHHHYHHQVVSTLNQRNFSSRSLTIKPTTSATMRYESYEETDETNDQQVDFCPLQRNNHHQNFDWLKGEEAERLLIVIGQLIGFDYVRRLAKLVMLYCRGAGDAIEHRLAPADWQSASRSNGNGADSDQKLLSLPEPQPQAMASGDGDEVRQNFGAQKSMAQNRRSYFAPLNLVDSKADRKLACALLRFLEEMGRESICSLNAVKATTTKQQQQQQHSKSLAVDQTQLTSHSLCTGCNDNHQLAARLLETLESLVLKSSHPSAVMLLAASDAPAPEGALPVAMANSRASSAESNSSSNSSSPSSSLLLPPSLPLSVSLAPLNSAPEVASIKLSQYRAQVKSQTQGSPLCKSKRAGNQLSMARGDGNEATIEALVFGDRQKLSLMPPQPQQQLAVRSTENNAIICNQTMKQQPLQHGDDGQSDKITTSSSPAVTWQKQHPVASFEESNEDPIKRALDCILGAKVGSRQKQQSSRLHGPESSLRKLAPGDVLASTSQGQPISRCQEASSDGISKTICRRRLNLTAGLEVGDCECSSCAYLREFAASGRQVEPEVSQAQGGSGNEDDDETRIVCSSLSSVAPEARSSNQVSGEPRCVISPSQSTTKTTTTASKTSTTTTINVKGDAQTSGKLGPKLDAEFSRPSGTTISQRATENVDAVRLLGESNGIKRQQQRGRSAKNNHQHHCHSHRHHDHRHSASASTRHFQQEPGLQPTVTTTATTAATQVKEQPTGAIVTLPANADERLNCAARETNALSSSSCRLLSAQTCNLCHCHQCCKSGAQTKTSLNTQRSAGAAAMTENKCARCATKRAHRSSSTYSCHVCAVQRCRSRRCSPSSGSTGELNGSVAGSSATRSSSSCRSGECCGIRPRSVSTSKSKTHRCSRTSTPSNANSGPATPQKG